MLDMSKPISHSIPSTRLLTSFGICAIFGVDPSILGAWSFSSLHIYAFVAFLFFRPCFSFSLSAVCHYALSTALPLSFSFSMDS